MSVPGLQPLMADIPALYFQAPDELIHLRFSPSWRRLIHSECERDRKRGREKKHCGNDTAIFISFLLLLLLLLAGGEEEKEKVKV